MRTSSRVQLRAVRAAEPDFAGANRYAIERLERELPPSLYYHNLYHTRDDVLPAAERLARLEGVRRSSCRLLATACCFHDIGFIFSPVEHEAASAQLAGEVLPHFGFSREQVAAVQGCILATRVFTPPRTMLEAVIVDADLDVLGRADFMARSADLRRELAAGGQTYTDLEWVHQQINFLNAHQYRTIAAQQLRGPKKRENMRELSQLLRRLAR